MKIDIHTHTKKCKSGDASTRETTPEKFCEAIRATDVKIVAITNHNVFDFKQYTAIAAAIDRGVQVWPGIEVDVVESESRAHLLVIVSPARAADFSQAVDAITAGSNPEIFSATIEKVLATFEPLEPLYVAHYKQKKPDLSDAALEKLITGAKEPTSVLKEVTNSISAGISISHGHASIYGSDVHDWSKYEEQARHLPELRLPVDSFEHFRLLLKKDPATINTALSQKTHEDLILIPFEDSSIVKLRAYNDINVIFGPKGTGKSCVLKAIAKHYNTIGVEAMVYEADSDQLGDKFDVKGRNLKFNLDERGINSCADEIKSLRTAVESAVTGISQYVAHFAANSTNRNAKKLRLKDLEPEAEAGPKLEFESFNEAVKQTEAYLSFLDKSEAIKKALTADEHQKLTSDLTLLLERLRLRQWSTFSAWRETCLLNSAIKFFRKEVERKSDSRAKPTTTGFLDYARNRIQIEASAAALLKCVATRVPVQNEVVGSLGSNKGELEFRTEFHFQAGDLTDGTLHPLTKAKKSTQKNFIQRVRTIQQHAYADDLFNCIAELWQVDDVQDIATVSELLQFKRYFALDGKPYDPSSGEASMLMLQKELATDREVYILDEPEKSLGNEYISDVIVPLVRERARAGKKIFISTHDANIAVRTLPYTSVYRCHGPKGYRTYTGNPFSNDLVNTVDQKDRLDWKKVSMRTLEGGEAAFGERGKIYGNHKS